MEKCGNFGCVVDGVFAVYDPRGCKARNGNLSNIFTCSFTFFFLYLLRELKLNCFRGDFSCPLCTKHHKTWRKNTKSRSNFHIAWCLEKKGQNGMEMFVWENLSEDSKGNSIQQRILGFIHAMINASFNLRISIVQSFIEREKFSLFLECNWGSLQGGSWQFHFQQEFSTWKYSRPWLMLICELF